MKIILEKIKTREEFLRVFDVKDIFKRRIREIADYEGSCNHFCVTILYTTNRKKLVPRSRNKTHDRGKLIDKGSGDV